MNNLKYFKLRYSLAPYVAIGIILGGVSLLAIVSSFFDHDFKEFIFGFIVLGAYSLWVFFLHGYIIYWENNTLVCRAADRRTYTRIRLDEITSIGKEQVVLEKKNGAYRPNLRLTVNGKDASGYKFIDISLRHFNGDDIRTLLHMIHAKRLEIEIPKGWLKESKQTAR